MKIRSKDFRVREGDDVDLKKWPTTVEPVYQSKERPSMARVSSLIPEAVVLWARAGAITADDARIAAPSAREASIVTVFDGGRTGMGLSCRYVDVAQSRIVPSPGNP